MKIVHLVAIAIACGDSLSSPLAQRASPNLDPDLLDDIRFHAPQDDTPEQVVDFLKTDADFQETYPEAGKALAIRAQEPGLKPSHRVPVAVSCVSETYHAPIIMHSQLTLPDHLHDQLYAFVEHRLD